MAAAARRTVALIAHDGMKAKMVDFATRHAGALAGFNLVGTGTTSARITAATGLPVHGFKSGPLGGDAQIGALVAEGGDRAPAAIFFFIDPLTAHPHEPDVNGLLRLANVHNTPMACNLATAELVLASLLRGGAGAQ